MPSETSETGPVMRLFEVRVKPGCADKLLRSFATTSSQVVLGKPGNQGYLFGRGVAQADGTVMFASIWKDLDAVKARFGEDWQSSFLPEGYEDMIEDCSVRHIDLSGGWHVDLQG